MAKSITFSEKCNIGYSLFGLGYRDYIAARFLLNNRFIVQGLTHASTSVEKYLKALIVLTSNEKENYNVHLDNFEKLKTILVKNNNDITDKFDPVFLNILGDSFKIRYYDNLKKPIFIGFYINQFIGELDYTIHFIETFIMKTEGSISPYQRAIKENDPHLYENNFILNKEDKHNFMEKPSDAFSIYIRSGSVVNEEKIVKGYNIANKYEGRIAIFTGFQTKTDNNLHY